MNLRSILLLCTVLGPGACALEHRPGGFVGTDAPLTGDAQDTSVDSLADAPDAPDAPVDDVQDAAPDAVDDVPLDVPVDTAPDAPPDALPDAPVDVPTDGPAPACGAVGQPCCPPTTCSTGLRCSQIGGGRTVCTPCGLRGTACCDGPTRCTEGGTSCTTVETNFGNPEVCTGGGNGTAGGECRSSGNACNDGLFCLDRTRANSTDYCIRCGMRGEICCFDTTACSDGSACDRTTDSVPVCR